MKPQQVQFCRAVAGGRTDLARKLISKIDVNQNNDWGCSPALMCLWALNRDPQTFSRKLDEFFPNANDKLRHRTVVAKSKEIEAIIRDVLLPQAKRTLNQLLKPIGLKVVSLDKVSDKKQDLFIESAFATVNTIINDEFFDDINASQRRLAESLFTKLLPLVEKMKQAIPQKQSAVPPTKEQPYTIQLLMAILNGKTSDLPNMPALNLQATLEPIGRTFLPSSGLPKPLPSLRCQPKPQREEEEEHKLRHRMAPGVH